MMTEDEVKELLANLEVVRSFESCIKSDDSNDIKELDAEIRVVKVILGLGD